jgi:FdhD protein
MDATAAAWCAKSGGWPRRQVCEKLNTGVVCRVSLRKHSKTETRLFRVDGGAIEERPDLLATEEPLEIRLRWGQSTRTVAVTMRTPGADDELAAGLLFAEGVIADRGEIARITVAPVPPARFPILPAGAAPGSHGSPGSPGSLGSLGSDTETGARFAAGDAPAGDPSNIVEVELAGGSEPELATLERHFFATSACGVCGKAGIEALRFRVGAALPPGPRIEPELVSSLPLKLRGAQGLFEATGGLHAAALFDRRGELLAVREDVGRHNALDKLVGWALLGGLLPLHDHLLLVSGRTSYEILQKSLVAGLPVVCAVSAPSSLAVEMAQRFGVTLIGFLRGDRFNVYSGIERIGGATAAPPRPVSTAAEWPVP